MTTRLSRGGRRRDATRASACVLTVLALTGCQLTEPDPAVMDSLAEMEIRIRLLQSELTDMRQALAARERQQEPEVRSGPEPEERLQARLDVIEASIAALPDQMGDLCPELPASPTVTTQCVSPEVQRVVVSGDKLVVGQVERVWLEPPAASLVAHIDPTSTHSLMHAAEPVEFERDGNKWIRFGVTADEQTVDVERPVKRFTRIGDTRRPVVQLRVQLGDVREAVEFVLMDLSEDDRPMVLGRNFLTDVALVDVAQKYVQPAFTAPGG